MRNSAKSAGRTSRWLLILLFVIPAGAVLALGLRDEISVRAAAPRLDSLEFAADRGEELLADLSQGAVHGKRSEILPIGQADPIALPVTREPRIVTTAEIRALVRDLAHDAVRWNAITALRELRRIGTPALPLLNRALRSRDRQQRQLAGMILYGSVDEPSSELLIVAVEALEHDRLPHDSGSPDTYSVHAYTPVHNAQAASPFLARFPKLARPFLARKLRSPDRQQSFLCASLMAAGCDRDGQDLGSFIGLVVNILSWHLQDNDIRSDAGIALSALAHLGQGARPFLPWELSRSDPQGRAFLEFLIQMVEQPTSQRSLVGKRMRAHGLDRFVDVHPDLYLLAQTGPVPYFSDTTAHISAAPSH